MILLNRRRLLVEGEVTPPYDYEVEYLQSDGTAYIDTGIKASNKVVINTYLVDYFTSDCLGKWPFGGRNALNDKMFGINLNANNSKVYMSYNSAQTAYNVYSTYPSSTLVEMGAGRLRIGGTTHTYTQATFTSSYNVYLFGLNNGGSAVASSTKIGPTYITDGTTTLDLIPVVKNGVPCYYDKLSGNCIYNPGGGSFTAGPKIPYPRVKWLECNGETYNTGILAASNTVLKVWVQKYFGVSTLEGKYLFGGRTAFNNMAYGAYVDGNAHTLRLGMRNTTNEYNQGSTYSSSCWVEVGGGTFSIGNTNHTYTNTSFTGSYNIALFGLNNAGTMITCDGCQLGEVWMARGTTSLYLIPVQVGTVGKYYNSKTGTLSEESFALGPSII